jgi:hypothetical protein
MGVGLLDSALHLVKFHSLSFQMDMILNKGRKLADM